MFQPFSQTVESDIEFDFLKHVTKKVFNNRVVITAHIKQRQRVDNDVQREEAVSETNCQIGTGLFRVTTHLDSNHILKPLQTNMGVNYSEGKQKLVFTHVT